MSVKQNTLLPYTVILFDAPFHQMHSKVQGQQAVRLTSSDSDDALTDAEDIRRYVTPLFRFAAFVDNHAKTKILLKSLSFL